MGIRAKILEHIVRKEIEKKEKAIKTVEDTANIAYDVARKVAKKFLPSLLVATDPNYLEKVIEENYTIADKIIEYHRKEAAKELTKKQLKAWKTFKTALSLFKKFSKLIRPFIDDFLTTKFIIEAIEDSRPDIAKLLKTEKGLKWLEKNIYELRNILGV